VKITLAINSRKRTDVFIGLTNICTTRGRHRYILTEWPIWYHFTFEHY